MTFQQLTDIVKHLAYANFCPLSGVFSQTSSLDGVYSVSIQPRYKLSLEIFITLMEKTVKLNIQLPQNSIQNIVFDKIATHITHIKDYPIVETGASEIR